MGCKFLGHERKETNSYMGKMGQVTGEVRQELTGDKGKARSAVGWEQQEQITGVEQLGPAAVVEKQVLTDCEERVELTAGGGKMEQTCDELGG